MATLEIPEHKLDELDASLAEPFDFELTPTEKRQLEIKQKMRAMGAGQGQADLMSAFGMRNK